MLDDYILDEVNKTFTRLIDSPNINTAALFLVSIIVPITVHQYNVPVWYPFHHIEQSVFLEWDYV